MWTNKKITSNEFYDNIIKFQNGDIDLRQMNSEISKLITLTNDVKIKESIKKLKKLPNNHKNAFYNKFKIVSFEGTTIIDKIKEKIGSMGNEEHKVEAIYKDLHSDIITNNYLKTCKRSRIVISYNDRQLKIKRSFNRSYDKILRLDRTVLDDFPEDISDQTFIKQLIDIDEIYSDEITKLRNAYTCKYSTCNKLLDEQKSGDLDGEDLKNYETEARYAWDIAFNSSKREIDNKIRTGRDVDIEEAKLAGRKCLGDIRCLEIINMCREMTQGYYYDLSDTLKVGWIHDWKDKYTNKRD